MSLAATVHAAKVDRYRRILTRGVGDYSERLRDDPDLASKRLPLLTSSQIELMTASYAERLRKRDRLRQRRFAKVAVEPVRPRARDARVYDRAMRRIVLRPLMRQIRTGLSTAVAAAEAIERLDEVPLTSTRREGLMAQEINKQARRLNSYQRRRLIQTFRAALGIDIRPVLEDEAIRPLMDAWRRENIDLIRTVPTRLMDDLQNGIAATFRDKPFDQQALRQVVAEKGKVANWNLRRITRDQTNKAISNLTQARHGQLGIEEYVWRTVQDERVREEHAALNGKTFRWDDPPAVGNPGEPILCRCLAEPRIPESGVAA